MLGSIIAALQSPEQRAEIHLSMTVGQTVQRLSSPRHWRIRILGWLIVVGHGASPAVPELRLFGLMNIAVDVRNRKIEIINSTGKSPEGIRSGGRPVATLAKNAGLTYPDKRTWP